MRFRTDELVFTYSQTAADSAEAIDTVKPEPDEAVRQTDQGLPTLGPLSYFNKPPTVLDTTVPLAVLPTVFITPATVSLLVLMVELARPPAVFVAPDKVPPVALVREPVASDTAFVILPQVLPTLASAEGVLL